MIKKYTSGNVIVDTNNICTSNHVIADIKNKRLLLVRIVFLICEIGISNTKKSIIDINNWIWMAAWHLTRSLVSRISILTSENWIADINNEYPAN